MKNVIKWQHGRADEQQCSRFLLEIGLYIALFNWTVAGKAQQTTHFLQAKSGVGLVNVPLPPTPAPLCQNIWFKWPIIWCSKVEDEKEGGQGTASSIVPLCVVWMKRNGKITANKSLTGKAQWRVPFSSVSSLLPSTVPSVMHVSLPRYAAKWKDISANEVPRWVM